MIKVVNSLLETKKLAIEFANNLKRGDVVLLNGNLGAGKTTFTQFVFEALGVKEKVTSPTFAILKSYEGKFRFHHFDAYRITIDEAYEAGFDEIFADKESIIFVEWSENIKELIPLEHKEVNINYIDEHTREFEIREIK